MQTEAAQPEANTGKGRMRSATIFASGNHRKRPWTPDKIDWIVQNFDRFSTGDKPAHEVPCVVGHEENDFADRTDLPASGWPKQVWREDEPCPECHGEGCPECFNTGERALLKADIDEIPPETQADLASGKFRYPSAEIYDSPEQAGLKGEGPMLRRIAFLGAEPPQVKRLGRLPPVEQYGERWPTRIRVAEVRRTSAGTWLCFSETVPMNCAQMKADLKGRLKGVSDAELAALSEPLLAKLHKFAEEMPHPAKVEGPPGKPDAPMASQTPAAAQPPGPGMTGPSPSTPHDALKKFAEMPDEEWEKHDPGMMKPEEKSAAHAYACRMYGEHFGTPHAEKWGARVRKFADMGSVSGATLGLVKDEKKPEAYSEIRRIAEDAAARVHAADRLAAQHLDRQVKRTIFSELDDLQRQGKVFPFERQGGVDNPHSLDFDLARCDAVTAHKFSENGKTVEMTELERKLEALRRRPADLLRYSEYSAAQDPAGTLAQANADAEKAKVQRHYRDNQKAFAKTGMTLEKFSEAYDSRKKHDPELTAEQFLNAGRK